jgi:hypothetical protein
VLPVIAEWLALNTQLEVTVRATSGVRSPIDRLPKP